MISYIAKDLSKLYTGDSCLVLGPSEGGEQEKPLSSYFKRVVCVDGSSRVLAKLKEACPDYVYVHSLFEELKMSEQFDTILLMHVLEHVKNPVALLRSLKPNLKKSGRLIACVPNARSLHRLLGVKMRLIKTPYELGESDFKVGHRRVYDMGALKRDIKSAGLREFDSGGIFLKPLSNPQLEKLGYEVADGFYELGKEFPESCAEIWIAARR